jgi:hypothetical protein
MNASDVSRALLLAHDPHGGHGPIAGKRYACPLPECAGKPVDMAHRSISVNDETGAWSCWRCHATGLLVEYRGQDDSSTFVHRSRTSASRTTVLTPPPRIPPLDAQAKARLRAATTACQSILRTPGAIYLENRGIDALAADACGVRYHSDWLGCGQAVVFAARNDRGTLVAAQGRFLNSQQAPKAMTIGKVRLGVYTTPGALDAAFVGITEAPIDALVLAGLSCPAIALFGTSAPPWLRRRLAFSTVLLATDADTAGEAAAVTLRRILIHGTRCERLDLPPGVKDVNEALLRDPQLLEALVTEAQRRDSTYFLPDFSSPSLLRHGAML